MDLNNDNRLISGIWHFDDQPTYIHYDTLYSMDSIHGGRRAKIVATIARLVGNYVAENKLGDVTVADGGYRVGSTILAPDVGFICKDRIPDEDFFFYPVAPDLAVEVLSHRGSPFDIHQKTCTYLNGGTQAVWNVYPQSESVDVVTLSDDLELLTTTLTAKQYIVGSAALSGFKVKVAQLFV